MTPTKMIAVPAVAALAFLSACGSTSAPAAKPAPATTSATPTPSPTGPQGFQIPQNLQRSLRRKMNQALRKDGLTDRVKDITCIEQGPQRATCLAIGTHGDRTTIRVVISADGMTYVSH